MHEVAIAQNIIEIVEAEAKRNDANKINKVKLRVGRFTCVVKEALEFAFEVVKQDTFAHDAAVEIEMVELQVECPKCGLTKSPENEYNFICVECGAPLDIVSGRELQVEYIEVD
jgi:hydrogenase nickel incorporation protein HypA/HybF